MATKDLKCLLVIGFKIIKLSFDTKADDYLDFCLGHLSQMNDSVMAIQANKTQIIDKINNYEDSFNKLVEQKKAG